MDLTERKHAENLLLENQRKLHIAQKLAFLGNYEINTINFKYQASQTTFDILGIDDTFIKSIDDFIKVVYIDDKDKVQNYYQNNKFEDINKTCEYRIINNKTGQLRWLSDFSIIEFNENGEASRIIGAIQDITARKNIEFDIQKNETKYSNLIENMELGILEVDNNEIITTVGQLNFFRWAIENHIIEYIIENYDIIESDMNNSLRNLYKKKEGENKRRKRTELSISATKTVNKHNISIIVQFD
jgi:PAS domain-containing protein